MIFGQSEDVLSCNCTNHLTSSLTSGTTRITACSVSCISSLHYRKLNLRSYIARRFSVMQCKLDLIKKSEIGDLFRGASFNGDPRA